MSSVTYALTIGTGLIFAFIVFRMLRKGLLHEKYALLWFGASVLVLILALWPHIIDRLAGFFGVQYAPSLLFMMAIMFCLGILLHLSVIISRLSQQNTHLAQDLALLKFELDQLKHDTKEGHTP